MVSTEPASPSALHRSRHLVDQLFGLVPEERLYERPIPLRHRLVFYLGHVDAFDWNLIAETLPGARRFEPDLDRLFAFGIDPDSTGAPSDTAEDWPDIASVQAYCRRVRDAVDKFWEEVPELRRNVAVEHRLMHAETLAYILHAMEPGLLRRPAESRGYAAAPRPNQRMSVPAGCATLGRNRGDGFGWDNEFPQIDVEVPAFAIDRFPATNGDYLRFVGQGGPIPHFWRGEAPAWRLRTMFDEIPLPLDWPVYVTQQQASAYAAWRGAALPTEAQWHRAAYATPDGLERQYPWGESHPECVPGNFDSRRWDPVPVGRHPETASAFGVEDLVGNGWEWTSTPFGPFPGFEPFPFYRGYSADFFDGVHFVLKGGSPRTDATFLRRSFRNWFRQDYPWAFATFRCAYTHP
jgi:formylglycine-generating enzyme required for sulfatase activity